MAPRLPLRPITSRAATRIRSRVSSGEVDRPFSIGFASRSWRSVFPVPIGTFVSYVPYDASATARTCGMLIVACCCRDHRIVALRAVILRHRDLTAARVVPFHLQEARNLVGSTYASVWSRISLWIFFVSPQHDDRAVRKPRHPVDVTFWSLSQARRIADIIEETTEAARVARHAVEDDNVEIGALEI